MLVLGVRAALGPWYVLLTLERQRVQAEAWIRFPLPFDGIVAGTVALFSFLPLDGRPTRSLCRPTWSSPAPPPQSLLPVSPAPFSIFTATVSQLLPLLMPKAEASTTFPKAPWPRTLPVEAGGQLQVSCIGGRGGVRMEKDGRQG